MGTIIMKMKVVNMCKAPRSVLNAIEMVAVIYYHYYYYYYSLQLPLIL